MRLTGAASVAAVVGTPIAHSLSPLIHNAWIEAAGLDAAFVPLEVNDEGFERLLAGLKGGVVRGVSITAPFKERALAAADLADEAAQRAGAANLLLFRPDGTVEARNTDGLGLVRALELRAPKLKLKGADVAMFGAGGAARGGAVALLQAGAARVSIVNRTYPRARILADALGKQAHALPWDQAAGALEEADLVVNATSGAAADELALPWEAARRHAVALDMVYRPLRTRFLVEAEARELQTVSGLDMLIGQAGPSFEAFFGRPPPAEPDVRALALKVLEAE